MEPLSGEFAAIRAALDVYDPLRDPQQLLLALKREGADWLSQSGDPKALAARLRTLPRLDSADPEVTSLDLNGDTRRDVVVQTHLGGLPVISYVAQEDGGFVGLTLPHGFEEPLLTMESSVRVEEITDEERPETIITYTVQGGSGWTELLYVFWCGEWLTWSGVAGGRITRSR